MARPKWPLWIAVGVGLVWGGGKAIDWISSSYAESSASNRVQGLFSNLQAGTDSTVAVAMWLTGSMETGSRQLDRDTWNAQYGRMMSWLSGGGLRYPIARFDIVGAVVVREELASPAVIVACEIDGQRLFVRAVDGRELEWASSSGRP